MCVCKNKTYSNINKRDTGYVEKLSQVVYVGDGEGVSSIELLCRKF